MNFKELKPGYNIYLLNRNEMKAETGKVISVSIPHLDMKLANNTAMVVDIDADINGVKRTYCMVADNETAYPAGYVISTGRESIAREVEAIKTQSQQALAQVDMHRRNVEKADALLAELDPAVREKQENEKRFSSLENSIEKLAELINKIVT